MRNQLKLKNNELFIYALIYGYSQNGENTYHASLNTMEKELKITKKTIIENLKRLIKKKLIIKESSKHGNCYYANLDILDSGKTTKEGSVKSTQGGVKTTQEECKNYTSNSVKTTQEECKNYTPYNNVGNNNINNNINKYIYIINYLNEKAGTSYKHNIQKTKELIDARFKQGFTVEDFIKVIDKKVKEWKGTKFEGYLRPITLFSNKFESYLNQNVTQKRQSYGAEGDSFNYLQASIVD